MRNPVRPRGRPDRRTALLRQTFQDLLGPARDMQPQCLRQIREKAATLDASQVMAMVRGR
ncbi:MAG: hypothetical protein ACK40S_10335 [Burkholderiaceae bacterium]